MTTARQRLLYVTPTMPKQSGNGLAMRAGAILEALACRFDIHLRVLPVAGLPDSPSDFVRRLTISVEVLDLVKNLDPLFGLIDRVSDPDERHRARLAYPKPHLSRFCHSGLALDLLAAGRRLDVAGLHVMRLYLAALAEPFLRQSSEARACVIDLDDDDSKTYERLAYLQSKLGKDDAGEEAAAESRKFAALGNLYIPRFDRVLVSSEVDSQRMVKRFPNAQIEVVPNCYPLTEAAVSPASLASGPLRLLFVGSFGYFPNVDAALYLCGEVLPALRELTRREIVVDLVGTGDASPLRAVLRCPEVRVHGFVEDLSSVYANTDVVVVPLRVGGGTRIKILEAFSHRVPVVTTTLGIEGLDAVDGEHVLCADDAQSFARSCLSLKENGELSVRLVECAYQLLNQRYTQREVSSAVMRAWEAALGNRAVRPIQSRR